MSSAVPGGGAWRRRGEATVGSALEGQQPVDDVKFGVARHAETELVALSKLVVQVLENVYVDDGPAPEPGVAGLPVRVVSLHKLQTCDLWTVGPGEGLIPAPGSAAAGPLPKSLAGSGSTSGATGPQGRNHGRFSSRVESRS